MSNPVPKNATKETLLNIIQGWYSAGADETGQTNSDVADRIGVHNKSVSKQNKFLLDVGLLEKDGNKKVLSDLGAEYAEALRHDRPEKEPLLAELLFNYEPTDSVVDYISINNPSEDQAIEQLEKITEHDSSNQVSLQTVLDLYIEAGIVSETAEGELDAVLEENYGFESRSSSEEQDSVEPDRPQTQSKNDNNLKDAEAGDSKGTIDYEVSQESARFGVEISYEIDGTEDPQQVYEIVSAIRKALHEDLDFNPDEREPLFDETDSPENQESDVQDDDVPSEPGEDLDSYL